MYEILRAEDEFLASINAEELKKYESKKKKKIGNGFGKLKKYAQKYSTLEEETLSDEKFLNIAEDLKVPKRKEIKTLLDVQNRIHELQSFRIEVMKHKDNELRYMKDRESFRIQLLIEKMFDSILQRYMQHILYGALPDMHPERIVMVLRVIYREEQYEFNLPDNIRSDSNFKPKQYKKLLFETFEFEIKDYFKNKLKARHTIPSKLEAIEELFEDLAFYDEHISKLFPPEYEFIKLLASGYERTTKEILLSWTKDMDTIDDIDKAHVYRWINTFMGTQLVTETVARYLGGIENVYRYVDECEELVIAFKDSRTKLLQDIIGNVVKQSKNPANTEEVGVEDTFIQTKGPSDIFRFIMLQLDPFKEFGEFFPIMVNVVKTLLPFYISNIFAPITEMLDEENVNYRQIIALINDFDNCKGNVKLLEDYIISADMGVSIDWVHVFIENCDTTKASSLELLAEKTTLKFKDSFARLFTSDWRKGAEIVEPICDQFMEVIDEFFEPMKEKDFTSYMNNAGELFTKWWLNEFLGSTKMEKMKFKELDVLKNDLAEFKGPFDLDEEQPSKPKQSNSYVAFNGFDSDSDESIYEEENLKLVFDLVHILEHYINMVEDQKKVMEGDENAGFALTSFIRGLQRYYGVTDYVIELFMKRTPFDKTTIEELTKAGIESLEKNLQYTEKQQNIGYFKSFKRPEVKTHQKKSSSGGSIFSKKKNKKDKKPKGPKPLHGIQADSPKSSGENHLTMSLADFMGDGFDMDILDEL
eukprot:CAMPEP_0117420536 /NCGR_PEP_ID=MMETSP0758-20121206/1848_1 /TAXON_ID=63605 /ORGANISM="Percolomonas cosmopolitus, Strain AE-1 (ATCC 50343)" /LENGTH=757 /DNA_ID=CAMNT_0005202199 /DNA_START=329 /DNA_END=2602 /DNA_ORIENTATION=+